MTLPLRHLNFCPEFFRHLGKRLDKKAEVNFKTYAVTTLMASN